MRTPVIAGNWKLFNTVAESLALVRDLKALVADAQGVEIVVAPVFTAIHAVAGELKGSTIAVSSQDVYWEESGAFTGEVAPCLLKEAGCAYAIIGHSERRQYFGETDETVNRKVKAALKAGLIPIMCVGELLEERESGKTMQVVAKQIKGGLADLPADDIAKIIIAYEPVWAIGTGKTATPAQAEEVHKSIRSLIAALAGTQVAVGMRILYGGSVKADNVDELMGQEDIDGALVGGASLKADSFARIVKFNK
ncbi:MAG: triose-phosphate isomerase [Deltaproteobacteria bacterium]|nr:triose-phosphate isomerase [Deltaproteobacteria bacterium]